MSDPAAPGPSDHPVEVATLKSWFRQNAVSLVMTVVAVGLVCYYLDPFDTLKVVFGLGLVIFIHELGHFAAAKWCDVHVRTFSIGFGPAVPFCSYKWGETTYMVGIVPLGGYVSMVGEGDASGEDDAEEDPRSFKHKSVGQRMFIISSGVVMNVLLGLLCFMAAYLHGVQEKPATIGIVESGSAAWRAGIRTDSDIKRIDRRENPVFNDLRPIVMSTAKDEKVAVVTSYMGKEESHEVEPLRDEGVYYPQLGVAATNRLTLASAKRSTYRPVVPGSPAAAAEPPFAQGDRVIATTDPADPTKVTPLPLDPRDKGGKQPDYADFARRMALLAGKPATLHVLRAGQADGTAPTAIEVAPAYRVDTGARMQMGWVTAVRKGSPADKAGIEARAENGVPAGDTILAVGVTVGPNGAKEWFANGTVVEAKPGEAVRPLDPIKLPRELDRWAFSEPPPPDRKLVVVVSRLVKHAPERVALAMDYDASYRFDRERVTNPNSPLPLPGLGVAYLVLSIVDAVEKGSPADAAELRPGDNIQAVQFRAVDPKTGEVRLGSWTQIDGGRQWASVDSALQREHPPTIGLKVKRGDDVQEMTLTGRPDTTWPVEERGLEFQADFRTQQATDVADALALGAYRTIRFIKEVYLNLYAMAFGRVSPRTMSGPLTIATVSYRFAGEDFWQFLLFLGMISVNLAVVNFLPIPVLDGGHMVFLLLEKVLGRPVPDKIFAIATWGGVAFIMLLMLYVLTLDVNRLFFGWF